ncbi:hypothetical protein EYB53_020375 [Candidatus Chloroploca sp. M-50]|uniref:Uncharacterized protein n=1 Tax=Candidatus Chloroploca mongolica TaxID=2528176 RepID=A0ABS4DF56_9CHLR|nr:hypothetical protein [Candidatus Chloroploca mongolica]MBP1468081.1 hypothetical protein [Candidatus Chloroploca mongolica]
MGQATQLILMRGRIRDIQDSRRRFVLSGLDLWNKREMMFPYLELCARVLRQLRLLRKGDQRLPQIKEDGDELPLLSLRIPHLFMFHFGNVNMLWLPPRASFQGSVNCLSCDDGHSA